MIRLSFVQQATPAPLLVLLNKGAPPVGQLPSPSETHSRGSFLYPRTGTTVNDVKIARKSAAPLGSLLEFHPHVSDVALTTKPTYKHRMSNGSTMTVMHTGTGLLYTRAE